MAGIGIHEDDELDAAAVLLDVGQLDGLADAKRQLREIEALGVREPFDPRVQIGAGGDQSLRRGGQLADDQRVAVGGVAKPAFGAAPVGGASAVTLFTISISRNRPELRARWS